MAEENLTIQSQITRIMDARNRMRLKLGTDFKLLTDVEQQTAQIDRLAEVLEGVTVHPKLSAEIDPQNLTVQIPAGYYPEGGTVSADMDFTEVGDANFSLYEAPNQTPTKLGFDVALPDGYYGFKSVHVDPIPTAYQDVTGVTAAQEQVLTGAFYVNSIGELKEGTMTNNGAVNATISVGTPEFTIPKGYHDGTGKIIIDAQAKEFTPDVAGTTITPDSGKVLSAVTIAPIPSQYKDTTDVTVTADKVLEGVTFVNGTSDEPITGTMVNNGSFGDVILSVGNDSVTVAQGYTTGGSVAVKSEVREGVIPTKAQQVIEGAEGAFLSKVVVEAIPEEFVDISGVTATPETVFEGYTFVDKDGITQTGKVTNNGPVGGIVDGINTTEVVIPAGNTTGGKVTFDQTAIFNQLAAI